MITGSRYKVKQFIPTISRETTWVRAPQSGVIRTLKKSGHKVIKGQTIAIIANPSSKDELKLTAPVSGIIIGDNKLPLVHEGEALFHIASFETLTVVEEQLENIQDSFDLTDEDSIF